jgi:hypothetical protein
MSQHEDAPQKELNFLTPAAIGGVTLGVISAVMGALGYLGLGILQLGCCLWLLGCPILAIIQLNKQRPGTLSYGDGALAGVLTGVFGAIVSTVLGIPIRILMAPQIEKLRDQVLNQNQQMPPAIKEYLSQAMQPGINVTLVLISLVLALIFYAIFGAAGGSLGVAIVNRTKTD